MVKVQQAHWQACAEFQSIRAFALLAVLFAALGATVHVPRLAAKQGVISGRNFSSMCCYLWTYFLGDLVIGLWSIFFPARFCHFRLDWYLNKNNGSRLLYIKT